MVSAKHKKVIVYKLYGPLFELLKKLLEHYFARNYGIGKSLILSSSREGPINYS